MTTATEPFTLRQSTLATFSRCPLSARFEIEAGERHAPELARGSLFHTVMERCLRAMHPTRGQEQIPQAEALEIMYEVLAEAADPDPDSDNKHGAGVLPTEERTALRQIVVRWVTDRRWNTKQIMALEQPLSAEVMCPDGILRTLTGTPDVLIAEPPDGVVIYDAKTGWGPPKTPRDAEPQERRRYLTERGNYQLDAYGLLVMREWPAVQRATLREDHPRVDEQREATLRRDELEHVERLIGIDLMLAERGLAEGPDSAVWKPVPGKQCAWCLRPRECPRAAATRGEGAIDSPEAAVEFALDVEPLTARRDHTLEAAKAWVDAHGPIELPDGRLLGWDMPPPTDAAKAPDAERGTCKWCGDPIYKSEAAKSHMLDKRRQYHGGPERGERDCKAAWDAAGGARSFRIYSPDEYGVAPDLEPAS